MSLKKFLPLAGESGSLSPGNSNGAGGCYLLPPNPHPPPSASPPLTVFYHLFRSLFPLPFLSILKPIYIINPSCSFPLPSHPLYFPTPLVPYFPNDRILPSHLSWEIHVFLSYAHLFQTCILGWLRSSSFMSATDVDKSNTRHFHQVKNGTSNSQQESTQSEGTFRQEKKNDNNKSRKIVSQSRPFKEIIVYISSSRFIPIKIPLRMFRPS